MDVQNIQTEKENVAFTAPIGSTVHVDDYGQCEVVRDYFAGIVWLRSFKTPGNCFVNIVIPKAVREKSGMKNLDD